MHAVNILEEVNRSNLVVVIDRTATNAGIDQVLMQLIHNYMSTTAKQLQKRSMRHFYYESKGIDCYKFRALLKMHAYLMQFLVGTGMEFEANKLKEICNLNSRVGCKLCVLTLTTSLIIIILQRTPNITI